MNVYEINNDEYFKIGYINGKRKKKKKKHADQAGKEDFLYRFDSMYVNTYEFSSLSFFILTKASAKAAETGISNNKRRGTKISNNDDFVMDLKTYTECFTA